MKEQVEESVEDELWGRESEKQFWRGNLNL
jgi:hypothetical protein